jgi:copper chaperone CopZ
MMTSKKFAWLLAIPVVALMLVGVAQAAEPTLTTLTVPKIDCPSCAKKVADALEKVSGVASVKTDNKAGTAVVTPKRGADLSPRALWEAVEEVGKQPTKLVGPKGTFTSKPSA